MNCLPPFGLLCDFYEERARRDEATNKRNCAKLCNIQGTMPLKCHLFYCVNNSIFYLGPQTVTENSKQPFFVVVVVVVLSYVKGEQAKMRQIRGERNTSLGRSLQGMVVHVADMLSHPVITIVYLVHVVSQKWGNIIIA